MPKNIDSTTSESPSELNSDMPENDENTSPKMKSKRTSIKSLVKIFRREFLRDYNITANETQLVIDRMLDEFTTLAQADGGLRLRRPGKPTVLINVKN